MTGMEPLEMQLYFLENKLKSYHINTTTTIIIITSTPQISLCR
jgi:hypothetical protein